MRIRTALTNTGAAPSPLGALRATLPVPADATELLDLTGRWCRERTPQRRPWPQRHLARARAGTAAPATTPPCCSLAGTPGFGFGRGEVWAVHVAWSGDHHDATPSAPRRASACSAAASCSAPARSCSAAGETYAAPWLVGSCVGRRARRRRRPAAPVDCAGTSPRAGGPARCVVNTWEAVYFDHDLDRLPALADAAAEVGVERFVLDDGWFRGRRDDRAGLGDWTVDPDGVARRAATRWSTTCTAWAWSSGSGSSRRWSTRTPTWPARTPSGCCAGGGAARPPGGHQQVLDLQHPGAYEHVRDALLRLLDELRHRVPQVGPQPRPRRRRARRAAGGARPDAGVLPAARRAARPPTRGWRSRRCASRRRPGRPRRC